MRPRPLPAWVPFLLVAALLTSLLLPALADPAYAVDPGLPLTEDFKDTKLNDTTTTNANWSTEEQALIMAWRKSQYGAFGQGLTALNIAGTQTKTTQNIALGDIDGDGDLDMVVANGVRVLQPGTQLDANQVFINTSGSFGNGIDIPNSADQSVAVELADINKDGRLDMVVANVGSENKIYLGNGDPAKQYFDAPINITTDKDATIDIAVGDLNGDGHLDLIAGNWSINGAPPFEPNKIYLGNGDAAKQYFDAAINITNDRAATSSVALGDMDNDGDLDLVTGDYGTANQLYINQRTPNNANNPANPFQGLATGLAIGAATNQTAEIALADMDGDGDLDVVEGNIGAPLPAPTVGFAGAANQIYLNDVINPAQTPTPIPFAGVIVVPLTGDPALPTLSIALGDVDGDGDMDIVTGNNVNGQVGANQLYINNGNGTITLDQLTQIAVGVSQTNAVALGDINGDGNLDLVEGNGLNAANRLLINNPTENPVVSVAANAAGPNPTSSFAIGDVNLDGAPDLVVGTNGGQDQIWINNCPALPNGCAPSANPFPANPLNKPIPNDPTTDVALADVDLDGDLDLLIAMNGQPNELWLNACAPAGCAANANPFPGIANPNVQDELFGNAAGATTALAVGDVNRDGWPDVVTGENGASNLLHISTAPLALGGAPPYFANQVAISTNAFNTQDIELADMNKDGWLDVVSGNANNFSYLYVSTPNVANPLASPSTVPIDNNESNNTQAVAIADINQDGSPDVILGNSGNPNRLYLGSGNGTVQAGKNITADADQTTSLVLRDVNFDGLLDLFVGNGIFNAAAQANKLYLGIAADPYFRAMTPADRFPALSNATQTVAIADMNQDGSPDLMAGNNPQADQFIASRAGSDPISDPFMTDAGRNLTVAAIPGTVTSMASGDIDKDGKLDFVVGLSTAPNQLFLNAAMRAATFSNVTGTAIGTITENTQDVALGDINRDGWLDLVVANLGVDNRVYLNTKSAPYFADTSMQRIYPGDSLNQSAAVALGDLNADGFLDVVIGNRNGQTNRLYLNAAPGPGAANPNFFPANATSGLNQNIGALAQDTRDIALGDMNNNGFLDVVVANYNQPNQIHLNQLPPAQPFPQPFPANLLGAGASIDGAATNENSTSLALGDFNVDGYLDVVVGNQLQINSLYLNAPANAGTFAARAIIAPDARNTQFITLVDIDNSGAVDPITGNSADVNKIYPFPVGQTGVQLTGENATTAAMLVADFDGDGRLDMIVDQGSQLRFYGDRLYHTARGLATSKEVDTETNNIVGATLDYTDKSKQPYHGNTNFWMSNNGGTNWFKVQPGVSFTFPTQGAALHWRAELNSRSPIQTPRISTLTVARQAAIALLGNGQTIPNGGTATTGNGTNFGAAPVGTATTARTFTINNTGARDLALNVALIGANNGEFALAVGQAVQAATLNDITLNIAAGGTGTFTVAFSPTGVGERTAKVSISSPTDAALKYEFDLKGEGQAVAGINVKGTDGAEIPDGSITVSTANGTDFGSTKIGQSVEKAFTLGNSGTAVLNLTGTPRIKFSPDNGIFTVKNLDQIPATVGPDGTAPFTIVFAPQSAATAEATVIIESDAGDKSYTFKVKGATITEPNIELRGQNGVAIPNGNSSPTDEAGTEMGSAPVNGIPVKRTLTIANTGTGALSVTSIASSQPDFTILSLASGVNVPPNSSVTFDVQFRPTAPGERTAEITVNSNDPDTAAYKIAVKGQGLRPGLIKVQTKGDGASVSNGGTIDFGPVNTSSDPVVKTVTIANDGDSELTLIAPSLQSGQGQFNVGALSLFNVAPGNQAELNITFAPTKLGRLDGEIRLANSDPTENPFILKLTGVGVAPAMVVKDANDVTLGSSDGGAGTTRSVDFGSVVREGASNQLVFQIENPGTAPLSLTGAPAVAISGAHAGDFGVVAQPSATVAPSGTVTFTVSFDPSEIGPRSAQLSIPSNASAQLLTINLTGQGTEVPVPIIGVTHSTDQTPVDVATTVQFPNAVVGSAGVTQTFAIVNSGSAPLDISSLMLIGDQAAEFSHTLPSTTTVAAGERQAFAIAFQPTAEGSRSAVVRIQSNDQQQAVYSFIVVGTGDPTPAPSMDLSASGIPVQDGSADPSSANGTDFGTAIIGGESGSRTYKLCNNGTAPMSIIKVEVNGASDEFSVDLQTPQNVAVNGCLDLVVNFTPKLPEERQATISLRYTTGGATAAALGGDESTFAFTVRGEGTVAPAPSMEIRGNGSPINAGDSTPNLGDRTDFGSATIGEAGVIQNFTIQNLGTAELSLSGDPLVRIEGEHAGDFTVTSPPGGTVPAGGSTSMSIIFTPGAEGLRNAIVSVVSNDEDASTYSFSIQGKGVAAPEAEIDVSGDLSGRSVSIAAGDSTPEEIEQTDFGAVVMDGSTEQHRFIIRNSGTAALNLSGVERIEIRGDAADDFTATQPDDAIPAGELATFTIDFAPSSEGERVAEVVIANNDGDESPYVFAIRGLGVAQPTPEMAVQGDGMEIKSGDTSPFLHDNTDFVAAVVGVTTVEKRFTIINKGTATLLLSGAPAVVINGEHADDFTVVSQPSTSVDESGGFTTFSILFSPAALGQRVAEVSIENNDASPFVFAIRGEGLAAPAPEIGLVGSGAPIESDDGTPSLLDSTDYGEVPLEGVREQSFVVLNSGSGTLTLTGEPKVAIAGPNADNFRVTREMDAEIDSGGSAIFSIAFAPTSAGLHQATVTIASDDEDEPSYRFAIQGTGREGGPQGASLAEMRVRGRDIIILADDATPSSSDGTFMGSTDQNSGRVTQRFTIVNQGALDLRLTGRPLIQFSGPNADEFSVVSLDRGDTIVANGGKFDFEVSFSAKAIGLRNAQIVIESSDPSEPSFTFSVAGLGRTDVLFTPLVMR